MLKLILYDILNTLEKYIPFSVITGSILIISVCIFISVLMNLTIKQTIGRYLRKLILLYLFYIYFFIVLSETYLSRIPGTRADIDLRLFGTFSPNMYDNRYIIENIILFIPYGLLLPLIWKKFYKFLYSFSAGLILSISIEISQFTTKRGFFQTDDIIMNMAGLLIGFGLIKGLRLFFGSIHDKG